MENLIKVLKTGTTKNDYPYYCQYISFTKDRIQTCNGGVFVDIKENKFPIEGCINIFVLENVLSNCANPKISQEAMSLKISDGIFKSEIMIDDMEFPSYPKTKTKFIIIDEEILYLLKSALKYTGDGLMSYVYVDSNYILSTQNKEKVFYHKHNYSVPGIIGLNSKIIATLSDGIEVGTTEHNTVVQFKNGKIIFQVALLDNFPKEAIIDLVENKPEVTKLCNVAVVQQAVKMVSSVLVNEQKKNVTLINKNNILIVKAESIVNGIAEYNIESKMEEEFEITMDASFLQKVDLDFDIFINTDSDFIYLSNGESEILIAGA